MTHCQRVGLVCVGFWLGVAPLAAAEEAHEDEAHEPVRFEHYLLNQGYATAERGEFAVELYNDVNFAEADNDDSYNSKHQMELEYGITDHLQLAYYEVYTWDRTKDWERHELKIEAKARFAEAGQWPVDVALYTEYKNPNGHRDQASDELENKVILSKTFGPWNVVGNFVFEKKLNTHSDWEFEYTAGISYALTPKTRVGLELKETLGDSDEFGFRRKDHQVYLVPGLYAQLRPHLKLLVGPAFGLTRASDDVQLKSIVEAEF